MAGFTQRCARRSDCSRISGLIWWSQFSSGPCMESAHGEPIACTAPHGQPSYRLSPAPGRPVRHDAGHSVQSSGWSNIESAVTRVGDGPRTGAVASRRPTQSGRAYSPRPRRRHCGRAAVRSAPPTVAAAWAGPRSSHAKQPNRAPCVKSMRTYTSPRLLMAPSRRRDPLASSFGVKPRKLAKCRPDGKRRMSATSASKAVAVITPTPGTVCKSVTSAISDASTASWCSTARMFVSRISNLIAGRPEGRAQQHGHRCRLRDQRTDLGDDVLRADRDKDAEFAQQAAEGIQPPGTRREPGGTQAVQRRDGLLLNRFDGNRLNLFVPIGFEEPLRVGAVGLIAPHIRAHVMRGQQPYRVTEGLQLARPVVRRPAGLKHDRCWGLLGEEWQESITREPAFVVEMAWPMRHRHLEYGFCGDRPRWSYAPLGTPPCYGLERPFHRWQHGAARQEESIPSLAADGGPQGAKACATPPRLKRDVGPHDH